MKKLVLSLAAVQPILLSVLALLYARLVLLLALDLYEHPEAGSAEQFIIFAICLILVIAFVVYAVRAAGRLAESFAARATALISGLANLSFGSAFYTHAEGMHDLVPLPLPVTPFLSIALACAGFSGVLAAAAVFTNPKFTDPAS